MSDLESAFPEKAQEFLNTKQFDQLAVIREHVDSLVESMEYDEETTFDEARENIVTELEEIISAATYVKKLFSEIFEKGDKVYWSKDPGVLYTIYSDPYAGGDGYALITNDNIQWGHMAKLEELTKGKPCAET